MTIQFSIEIRVFFSSLRFDLYCVARLFVSMSHGLMNIRSQRLLRLIHFDLDGAKLRYDAVYCDDNNPLL